MLLMTAYNLTTVLCPWLCCGQVVFLLMTFGIGVGLLFWQWSLRDVGTFEFGVDENLHISMRASTAQFLGDTSLNDVTLTYVVGPLLKGTFCC